MLGVSSCCRCVWPFVGKKASPKFPDVDDIEHNEEEDHLLDNVIESDDEQADPLSPDQIRRYLDESRDRGGDLEVVKGGGDRPGRAEQLLFQRHARSSLVDEHDELFDEDLEDAPDGGVVAGARLPRGGGGKFAGSGNGGFSEETATSASTTALSTSTSASSSSRREGSLRDWIDTGDEVPPAIPMLRRPPPGGQRGGADADGGGGGARRPASQRVSVEALGVLPPRAALPSFPAPPAERRPSSGAEALAVAAAPPRPGAAATDWAEALDSVWLNSETDEDVAGGGQQHAATADAGAADSSASPPALGRAHADPLPSVGEQGGLGAADGCPPWEPPAAGDDLEGLLGGEPPELCAGSEVDDLLDDFYTSADPCNGEPLGVPTTTNGPGHGQDIITRDGVGTLPHTGSAQSGFQVSSTGVLVASLSDNEIDEDF